MAQNKYVYFFGGGKADGRADMKDLLGGKGANLAEMTHIGLPVPAGFTITTEVCNYYYANNRTYPPELRAEVFAICGLDAARHHSDRVSHLLF
jgi:pyruvate, orthophosphate dikinase